MTTLACSHAHAHTLESLLCMRPTLPLLLSSTRSPRVLLSHISLVHSGPQSPGQMPLLSAMQRPAFQHPRVNRELNLWGGIAVSLNVGEVKVQGLGLSQLIMGSICLKQAHPWGAEGCTCSLETLALPPICVSVGDPWLLLAKDLPLLPVSQPAPYWDGYCLFL